MKLYLVRHGIAVEGLVRGISSDSQRPLTEEGIEETKMVARSLKRLNVKPEVIVSSPLVRAEQTAEILKEQLFGELMTSDSLCPGVTAQNVYKFLKEYADKDEIMLVGHEPDMGELVKEIVCAGFEFSLPFAKAGVCCVEVADLPPTMPGTLKWLVTPKLLADLLAEDAMAEDARANK